MYAYTIIDINECIEDANSCAQICADTDGSYTCSCEVGYNLAYDGSGCDGTSDRVLFM